MPQEHLLGHTSLNTTLSASREVATELPDNAGVGEHVEHRPSKHVSLVCRSDEAGRSYSSSLAFRLLAALVAQCRAVGTSA